MDIHIGFWGFVPLVIGIIAVVLYYLGQPALWFIAACFGFRRHLKAAKQFGLPTGPIWKKAHRHIWLATVEHLDYAVTLRSPDLGFNYGAGVYNHITKNVGWLSQLGYALQRDQKIVRVAVNYVNADLTVHDTLDCSVGVLPGSDAKHLFLFPHSTLVESVIGFDLVKLGRTVNFYRDDIDSVVIAHPRSMIDGNKNTIEYLSACNGTWLTSEYLAFQIRGDLLR